MKRRLVEFARQAFHRFGYEVRTQRLAVLETALHHALVDWTRTDFSLDSDVPRTALGVIFSKDRALQLHALLETPYTFVSRNPSARSA